MWFILLVFTAVFIYFAWRKSPKSVDFRKKYVLITGCDTGLGRQLALELVNRKISVFACCLTANGAESIRTEAAKIDENSKIWTPIFDVTKDGDATKTEIFVEKVIGDQGQLWSIVCNAGVLGAPVPDDWLSTSDYEKTLSVNLLGTMRTCQTFKKHLRKAEGRIIIVSSCLGLAAMPYIGPYTVSKFAVEGYADTLRNELAPQGVTVHTIIPGFYSTNLTSGQMIENEVSKTWNRAKSDTKEFYGEEYFQQYKKAIVSSLTYQCSADSSPVIEAYINAITAKHPKRRYRIGWDAFGFLILGMTRPVAQDKFNKLFWKYFIRVPSPKSTNAKKTE